MALWYLTGRPALLNKSGSFAPEIVVLLGPYLGAVWLWNAIRKLLNRTGQAAQGSLTELAVFETTGCVMEFPRSKT